MNNNGLTKILFAALLILFAGGTFLRLSALDRQSLWQDEIHTAVYVTDNPTLVEVVKRVTSQDLHSPAYYMLLWAHVRLLRIFGLSLSGGHLRLLSVFLGIFSMVFFWLFILRLYGNSWYGLLGAFLAATSMYALYYSQELRMYALVLAIAPAFLYFQLGLWDDQKGGLRIGSTVGYVLSGWILLYTSLICLFFVAGTGVGLLLTAWLERKQYPKRWYQVLSLGGIILLGYLPWVGAMWHKSMMLSGGVQTGLVIKNPRELFKFAFENLLFHSWKIGPGYGQINKIFRTLILFSLVNLWDPRLRRQHRLIQAGFLFTFLVYFIVTMDKPFHTGRYFSPWWPFALYFMIAAFSGAMELGRRFFPLWRRIVVAVFLLFFAWTGWVQANQIRYYFTQFSKEDWRGIAAYLPKFMTSEDVLVVSGSWHQTCMTYYGVALPMLNYEQVRQSEVSQSYRRFIYIENEGPEGLGPELASQFIEQSWPFATKRLFIWEPDKQLDAAGQLGSQP